MIKNTRVDQGNGFFLVLRKLLLVRFCVVVWVLFSVFSILCITSLVSATPRSHPLFAFTAVKLLACTQTSSSFCFRQQKRMRERARSARRKKKELLTVYIIGKKEVYLGPHVNALSFCLLLPLPLLPCTSGH